MTYYHEQVLQIRERHFPRQYVIDRVIKAKRLLEQHSGSDIDIQFISDLSFVSKFHFIRLFRKCYGITPHQYLTATRIKQAKVLLNSNTSVMDTCFQLGFDSPSSFSALFKKHTGITPSAYRQKSNFRYVC